MWAVPQGVFLPPPYGTSPPIKIDYGCRKYTRALAPGTAHIRVIRQIRPAATKLRPEPPTGAYLGPAGCPLVLDASADIDINCRIWRDIPVKQPELPEIAM